MGQGREFLVSCVPLGWEFWFSTSLVGPLWTQVWGHISLSEDLPNPLPQIKPSPANCMLMTVSVIKDSNLQQFGPLSKIIRTARSPGEIRTIPWHSLPQAVTSVIWPGRMLKRHPTFSWILRLRSHGSQISVCLLRAPTPGCTRAIHSIRVCAAQPQHLTPPGSRHKLLDSKAPRCWQLLPAE